MKPFLPATLAGVAALAAAQPQQFPNRLQTIRAGVIVAANDGSPAYSAAPYAWYNLDRLRASRPASWSFVNPHPPSQWDANAVSRWNGIRGVNGFAGDGPDAFAKVQKNEAAYWEVSLSGLTDQEVGDYDVLLVSPRALLQFTPAERERLRRFMDGGGILWAELASSNAAPATALNLDLVNGLPLSLDFRIVGNMTNARWDARNGVVARPNALSVRDAFLLGTNGGATREAVPVNPTSTGLATYYQGIGLEGVRLRPFGRGDTGVFASLARVGDGALVVTTSGIAHKLNGGLDPQSGLGNYNWKANPATTTPATVAAARFAANVVALADSSTQPANGSRKQSSGIVDVEAPLMRRFDDRQATEPTSRPVVYQGYTAISYADGVISVYDTSPDRDLDGDGDPDDGIYTSAGVVDDTLRDYSLGRPRDLIWTFNVGSRISAPVIAPVETVDPVTGAVASRVFVLVTDETGALRAFDLDLRAGRSIVGSNAPREAFSVSPPSSGGYIDAPIPPLVHDDKAYVVDMLPASPGSGRNARVYVVDLRTGTIPVSPTTGGGPAQIGSQVSGITLPTPTGTPTIGLIPIYDYSGGSDLVMYLPFAGVAGGNQSGGFSSLWLGARGEKPANVSPNPDGASEPPSATLDVETRASRQNAPSPIDPGSVRLRLVRPDGTVYTAADIAATFVGTPDTTSSPGTIRFTFRSGPTTLPQGTQVRVDYDLDLGSTVPYATGVLRGSVRLPDDATASRRVLGNLALTPKGTVVAVFGRGLVGSGGGLYSIREEGRGSFRMLSRYELFDAYRVALGGSTALSEDEVFFDKDPINSFLSSEAYSAPSGNRRLRGFAFQGGPAVKDGKVYVVATAAKRYDRIPAPIPLTSTYLMCFDAEPATPEIRAGSLPNGTIIVQGDIARANTKKTPDVSSFIAVNGTNYDPDRGVLRFENVANAGGNDFSNALSRSQSFIIRAPGQVDRAITPDAIGAKWSPLNWFTFIPMMTQSSDFTPVVTGNTVYVGGASFAAGYLATPSVVAERGILAAFDAEVPPNDAFLKATDELGTTTAPYRPWQKQLWSLTVNAGTVNPNPHQKWPQSQGIRTFDDYRLRLLQTELPGSQRVFGLAGAEGALVAAGSGGFYGFERSDIMIADAGRLITVDGSGNAISSLSAGVTAGAGIEVSAGKTRPFVNPSRAYPMVGSQLLVTDPGSDRVSLVSEDGTETRTITDFEIDKDHLPQGWTSKSPTKLESPRDAIMYATYVFDGNTADTADDIVSNQRPVEYWYRYLIADTGNRRLIELADRYEANATDGTVGRLIQRGVLVYHSPSAVDGRRYAYNSVSRVYVPGFGARPSRYVFVVGAGDGSGANATGRNQGGAKPEDRSVSSGILIFDPLRPQGVQVISSATLPSTSDTRYWDGSAWVAPASGTPRHAALGERQVSLAGVSSVSTRLLLAEGAPSEQAVIRVMVTSAGGVYELNVPINQEVLPSAPQAVWMLNASAYRGLINDAGGVNAPSLDVGAGFRPLYARRLDDGDVLVVNGYSGVTRGNLPFRGEVVQLDGQSFSTSALNLGFNRGSVRLKISSLTGTRGLLNPIFADRR